jgi:hypothetical protein
MQPFDSARRSENALAFYCTSPAHLPGLARLSRALGTWRVLVLDPLPIGGVGAGIAEAAAALQLVCHRLRSVAELETLGLPETTILAFGAVFERFALDLFGWAKARGWPVVAFEEVAQLALNDCRINNYDAPFDRLFLASPGELALFRGLGYPADMLQVSGLLSHDAAAGPATRSGPVRCAELGQGQAPIILYTTSPLLGRKAIHNLDDAQRRAAILRQIGKVARRRGARVVVKLHPNEDRETEQARIRCIVADATVIGRERGIRELIETASVVVNRGSSQTALDAALSGVPTVIAALGLRTLFHDCGGAWIAERLADIPRCIERALYAPAPRTDRLRERHDWAPPQGSASLIAAELRTLAGRPAIGNEATWRWLVKSMLFTGISLEAARLASAHRGESRWMSLVAAALDAHFAGWHEVSARCWRQLAEDDPDWFFPWHELAHKSMSVHDYRSVADAAGQAMARHPPFHRYWHAIPMTVMSAEALRALGRFAEAGAVLDRLDATGIGAVVPQTLMARARLDLARERRLRAALSAARALAALDRMPCDPDEDLALRKSAEALQIGVMYDEASRWRRLRSLLLRVALSLRSRWLRASDRATRFMCARRYARQTTL